VKDRRLKYPKGIRRRFFTSDQKSLLYPNSEHVLLMGCRGLSISLRSITAADRALPVRTIIPFGSPTKNLRTES
jgi:hypothetical protein